MKRRHIFPFVLTLFLCPTWLWAQSPRDAPAKKVETKRAEFYPMSKAQEADNKEAIRLLNILWNQESAPWREPLMKLAQKPDQHPAILYMIALQMRHVQDESISKELFERIIRAVDERTKKMRRSPSNSMLMYKGISLYALNQSKKGFSTLDKIKATKEKEWSFSPCQTIFGFQNLAGLGDLKERQAWLKSYQKRFPQCASAIQEATTTDLFQRKRTEDVEKMLDKSVQSQLPTRTEALRISDLYVQTGKAKKAIKLIRQVCQKYPCDEELRDKIFRASTRTSNNPDDINEVLKNATNTPDDSLLQYEAAILAYFSNQYQRSLRFFQNAQKTWPKDPNILAFRAMALSRTGAQEEAEQVIELAISAPKRPAVKAMFFRAVIYRNTNLDLALESIESYRKLMQTFSGIEIKEKAQVLAFEEGIRVESARRKQGEAPRPFADPDPGRTDPVQPAPQVKISKDCQDSYYCGPASDGKAPKKIAPIQTEKMVPDMIHLLKAGTISLKTGPPSAKGATPQKRAPDRTPTETAAPAAPTPAAPVKSVAPPKSTTPIAPSPEPKEKPQVSPQQKPAATPPTNASKSALWPIVGGVALLSLGLFALLFVRKRRK